MLLVEVHCGCEVGDPATHVSDDPLLMGADFGLVHALVQFFGLSQVLECALDPGPSRQSAGDSNEVFVIVNAHGKVRCGQALPDNHVPGLMAGFG